MTEKSSCSLKKGDAVVMDNGTWTYANIIWIVWFVYKNKDVKLREFGNPKNEISRYGQEELRKLINLW